MQYLNSTGLVGRVWINSSKVLEHAKIGLGALLPITELLAQVSYCQYTWLYFPLNYKLAGQGPCLRFHQCISIVQHSAKGIEDSQWVSSE